MISHKTGQGEALVSCVHTCTAGQTAGQGAVLVWEMTGVMFQVMEICEGTGVYCEQTSYYTLCSVYKHRTKVLCSVYKHRTKVLCSVYKHRTKVFCSVYKHRTKMLCSVSKPY